VTSFRSSVVDSSCERDAALFAHHGRDLTANLVAGAAFNLGPLVELGAQCTWARDETVVGRVGIVDCDVARSAEDTVDMIFVCVACFTLAAYRESQAIPERLRSSVARGGVGMRGEVSLYSSGASARPSNWY
jgi:hypothetical protein